jgi:hypothetical protein
MRICTKIQLCIRNNFSFVSCGQILNHSRIKILRFVSFDLDLKIIHNLGFFSSSLIKNLSMSFAKIGVLHQQPLPKLRSKNTLLSHVHFRCHLNTECYFPRLGHFLLNSKSNNLSISFAKIGILHQHPLPKLRSKNTLLSYVNILGVI